MFKNRVLGALLLFLALGCRQQPESPPAISVEVQNLESENLQLSTEFVGRLEAKQKEILTPIVNGIITDITVDEGDTVEPGDVIVQIQPSQEPLEAETKNSKLNQVTATIAGIVSSIQPTLGEYVETGQEITTIIQNDVLEINISVFLEQASKLEIGLPVEIVNRQGKAIAKGEVNFISPQADRSGQAILVKATINNNGKLKDGSFARARIIWSEQPAILIPVEAVARISRKTFVFVAEEEEQEDGKKILVAEQRLVELGAIQGQSYQVISGLEPGTILITDGIRNLADDTPITIEKPQTPHTSN